MVRTHTCSRRYGTVLALSAGSILMSSGCTQAAADAAAAGALNFIQNGVSSVLTDIVFGGTSAAESDDMAMDDMAMDEGEHDMHDG